MTREEFERGYAERSGMTVVELRGLGLFPIPCECDEDDCDGWQMSSANRAPPPWRKREHDAWTEEMARR